MKTSVAMGRASYVLLAALACNRETRSDKVNEASVEASSAPETNAGVPATMTMTEPTRAQAELTAAEGTKIDGRATFFQQPDGVLVVLEVEGAPPGKKGVHVHMRGDCSDMKNESMGPHFAPRLEQHALPSEGSERHLGDLGNITVADDGKGRLEIKVPSATLGADEATSFLGRALIVHASEDTGSAAQPAGNSGTPMACGVIHEEGT